MKVPVIDMTRGAGDEFVQRLRARLRGGGLTARNVKLDIPSSVASTIAAVARRGDRALIELERRFDKVRLSPAKLRVLREHLDRAHQAADAGFLRLVRRVRKNIRQYQESILIRAPRELRRGSRRLSVRYTPVDRVGVYVPGGRAIYPSTVLMTVVPAQVAGVRSIAIASPPTTGGEVNPLVLALAKELGITEVYRLGGAQAIAALALGTKIVTSVDKIVGPGNAFVAEAKRQLLGRVGIDSIAGPSEVLIVADGTARADWIAADMMAQAEHDPGSAILVTDSKQLKDAVLAELDRQVAALSRSRAIVSALESVSAIIVTGNLEQACQLANGFATEHLQIIVKKSREEKILKQIRHAGAIFVGPCTPVPLGDYYAGPSHVLPTGGTARFFSALSCNDFLKASSVIRYDAKSLAADAADVIDFATREGLTAHAEAVRKRSSDRM